jgi:hypothetical protein
VRVEEGSERYESSDYNERREAVVIGYPANAAPQTPVAVAGRQPSSRGCCVSALYDAAHKSAVSHTRSGVEQDALCREHCTFGRLQSRPKLFGTITLVPY